MPDKDWKITFEGVENTSLRLEDTTMCIREHAPDPAGNLDADTVAGDVADWLGTKWRAMAPTDVKLSVVRSFHGGPYGPGEGDPQESGISVVNGAGSGAASAGTLPHGVCGRITVYTGLASRRGRGRFHAPSPNRSSALNGPDVWATADSYWTAMQDFAVNALGGHDVTHDLIVHHYSLRVHSRADATTRDATRVLVRPQVSYLRSRLSAP